MTFAWYILFYVIFGISNYFLFRYLCVYFDGTYTTKDRVWGIVSSLFGPLSLLIVSVAGIIELISRMENRILIRKKKK